MIWSFLIWNRQKSGADQQGLHLAEVGIRKFSHFELKEAYDLYFEMAVKGISPNVVTYSSIISSHILCYDQ